MSEGFYLEETSYRLIERLTMAMERIADKLDEQAQPSSNSDKTICPECGGAGKLVSAIQQIVSDRNAKTICPYCKGTGHIV